jgi:hypothetical protein
VLPDFALVDFDLDDLAFFVSFFASIFELGASAPLGGLSIGAERERGRKKRNKQFPEHDFSSVG